MKEQRAAIYWIASLSPSQQLNWIKLLPIWADKDILKREEIWELRILPFLGEISKDSNEMC